MDRDLTGPGGDNESIFIDIAMGNQKHRIQLKADSNSEQVSSEFAKRH